MGAGTAANSNAAVSILTDDPLETIRDAMRLRVFVAACVSSSAGGAAVAKNAETSCCPCSGESDAPDAAREESWLFRAAAAASVSLPVAAPAPASMSEKEIGDGVGLGVWLKEVVGDAVTEMVADTELLFEGLGVSDALCVAEPLGEALRETELLIVLVGDCV